MKSIIQDKKAKQCYLCMILNNDYSIKNNLEEHHVFGGTANRSLSTKFGLLVYLCHEHHTGSSKSAHFDKDVREILHVVGQKAFELKYPDLSFRGIFGKNYL